MNRRSGDATFLAFDHVTIRLGERTLFRNTHWTWRAGEQWAVLGPDGSGKRVLLEALMGRAPVVRGEVHGPFPAVQPKRPSFVPATAHLSPQTHRELAVQESSFYQLRWHSGLEHGPRTVAEFLSQDSVEERNPFEVYPVRGNRRVFIRRRRQFVEWLGIQPLWRRRLLHLSHGELRKTLLAHVLLKSARLLILEDPFAGLDAGTRGRLGQVITRLMRRGEPVLVATHRPEEIPVATTHLLLVHEHEVLAQGPKRAMLAWWRQRFGSPPTRSGPRPALARRPAPPPGQHGPALLELEHVTVTAGGRKLLDDVHWTLRAGEAWVLLGPNGAGKTTLLSLIQGDHPRAGSLEIRRFGRSADSPQSLWRAREKIGWMSPELHQHYPGHWEMADVVCSGFFNSVGLHQACSWRQRLAARQWLFDLGLARHAGTPFRELSFGHQRLVLLARAVVKQPRLLILDEPCQGLDGAQRRTLLAAVDRVVGQTGASLIFVTHHPAEVPGCVTHRLCLVRGRVQEALPIPWGQPPI